jgi:hypothetical protein
VPYSVAGTPEKAGLLIAAKLHFLHNVGRNLLKKK